LSKNLKRKGSSTAKKPQKVNSFTAGWQDGLAKTSPAIVCVTWLDAARDPMTFLDPTKGWQAKYGQMGAYCQDVGFLLSQDEHWTFLGASRHAGIDSNYRDLMAIPSYAVANIEVLKEGSSGA